MGGRAAYLIQLSISFLYIQLMLGQPDLRHFSWTANWTRALGSAMVVVFFYLHFPNDRFLLTIGTASAMIDADLHLPVPAAPRAVAGGQLAGPGESRSARADVRRCSKVRAPC